MADTKTSDESAATALSGAELFRAVQSAANVKATATQIKTWCSASPTFVTPVLGVATGTSLALGGATIGSNALAVTGLSALSSTLTITQATAATALLVSTGGSNTGSNATSALDFSWTLNTSGSPDLFALRVTDTARGSTTSLFSLFNGASGATRAFAIDRTGFVYSAGGYAVGGAVAYSGGSVTIGLGYNTVGGVDVLNSGHFGWTSSSTLSGAIDTALTRVGAAIVGIGTGAAAGVTGTLRCAVVGSGAASDLALQYNTTTTLSIQTGGVLVASGKTFTIGNAATTGLTAGILAASTNASIVITDSTGQAYRIPCII